MMPAVVPPRPACGLSISLKRMIAVAGVALSLGVGLSTVWRAGPYEFGGRSWGSTVHRTDYTVYHLAGRAVLEETDLYQVRNQRGWAYVYPPLFAILMTPLALLPVFWGALIWYLLSAGLLASAALMCARIVRQTTTGTVDIAWLVTLPVFLLLIWLVSGLTRGQASIPLCWLVLAAICWQWKGCHVWGGVCLAGAVVMKVFPIVVLAYFVWRRKWRFVLATLVALLIGVLVIPALVLGWQKNLTYLHDWTQKVALASVTSESAREKNDLHEQLLSRQKMRNQSLDATLWRITGSDASKPMALAIGLAMAGVMWRVGRKASPEDELGVVSAVLVWTLLIPPVSESHYFGLLILPLALLTSVALSRRRTGEGRLATGVLVLFGFAAVAAEAVEPLKKIGYLCWISMAVWAALMVLVARRTWSGLRDPAGNPPAQP